MKPVFKHCMYCYERYIPKKPSRSFFCKDICRAKFNQTPRSYNESESIVKRLTITLAKFKGKDDKWVRVVMQTHKEMLIDDAHHGYNSLTRIYDLRDLIKLHYGWLVSE